MIEKIVLQIADESGNSIEIVESSLKLQSKIDIATAGYFSAIIFYLQDIADDEIKAAEKFHFAHTLKFYLKEIKENAN
jgi:hypothetical protein